MKFLDLSRTAPSDLATFPTLGMATDSAFQLPGRPIFLTDTADTFDCEILLAYRINRLGKSIAPKFAPRYYDVLTLLGRIVPLNTAVDPLSPWLNAIDFSIAQGQWSPIDRLGCPIDIATPQGHIGADIPSDSNINSAIATLSRYFTLKNGDIIVADPPLARFAVAIDTFVNATCHNQPILTFKIK